jgi:peptide/nickel transport system substrate-binding protein
LIDRSIIRGLGENWMAQAQRGLTLAAIAVVVAAALATAGCGASRNTSNEKAAEGKVISATTPAGETEVDRITWALYREPTSVDPIMIGDYPENTVGTLLCESLFRQTPESEIGPGLATGAGYPDPRTMVIELRDDVTFWDGSPMTAEDVAYSIERQRNPKLGGFWGGHFQSVDAVEVTGPNEVTLKLKRPDYTLEGVLSFSAGMVVSKAVAEEQGEKYGTPDGEAMCTGAYRLGPWKTGDVLSVVRNDDYWNGDVRPKVRQIDFRSVPEEPALTSGLLSGEIDGVYPEALSTLDQVRRSSELKVYEGPSVSIAAMVVNPKGPLGDARVRRALSMAIDRQGLVDTLYKGTGEPARVLTGPATWGYERDAFREAYEALPPLGGDLEEAKRLVEEAGAVGDEIVLATSSEINNIEAYADATRNAAQAIGLEPRMVSTSAQNYINYFIADPTERDKVDGFFTSNWVNWPDPGAMYDALMTFYYGHEDAEVSALLDEWRSTEDPAQRAEAVVEAQAKLTEALVWIPIVQPNKVLVMSSELTGAVSSTSQLFAPWADQLGASG